MTHAGATLPARILQHAEDTPSAVACHFLQSGRATAIRFGDIRREAARYANLLRKRGVERGDVVLIIFRHSPDLIYAFVGAMLAGAVPSFMPPLTSKQEAKRYWRSHEQLFARIREGVVLTTQENAAQLRHHLPDLYLELIESEAAAQCSEAFETAPAAPDEIAFLQHSSGTTGLKKGVALSHKAVLRQIDSYAATLGLTPADRIVSWLPLYHDMGLIACFLLPLASGVPLVLMDPFEWVVNPGLLFAAIKDFRATLCWLPNFAFHHLCRTVRATPALDLTSMRAWIDCSEPCRAETFRLFAQKFATAGVRVEQLQVCYAMAETVFAVTQTELGRAPRTLPHDAETGRPAALSAGRPIDGLNVSIRDEQGRDMPDGSVGEIVVSGHCLFAGYLRLEDETRRKLRNGWYHTGDLGFSLDGELFVTGRKNDLIIVHGRNHYAHELEFVVNQVPGVSPGRAVAVGWFRSEVGSEEVVILAEADHETGASSLPGAIKQALLNGAGLLAFDVRVVPSGWLVKTTSGKLSRKENLEKYLAALVGPPLTTSS